LEENICIVFEYSCDGVERNHEVMSVIDFYDFKILTKEFEMFRLESEQSRQVAYAL
jgi:hypothetical protein